MKREKWILDTYLSTMPPHERFRSTHVVTGKPVKSGGSLGREKATGQGVVYLMQEWAKDHDFNLKGAKYIVQGFGNVGSWVARLMKPLGARLIAVEDITGRSLTLVALILTTCPNMLNAVEVSQVIEEALR